MVIVTQEPPRRPPRLSPLVRFKRFLFRLGRRHVALGFDVRAFMPGRNERDVIFGKIDRALELLSAHDPRRFEYLRRDLPRIFVGVTPAAVAQCISSIGMCVLDHDYVVSEDTTAAQLAQTFVHEGAHARLDRAGFRYGEMFRARIERICFLEEAAFARRLPGGARLVEEAESNLERPEGFYSNSERRRREIEVLKSLGWIGRVVLFLINRREGIDGGRT